MSTGKFGHSPCLLQCFWLLSFLPIPVRAVTSLAFLHLARRPLSSGLVMSVVMRIARQFWLMVAVITYQIPGTYGSFLESILQMAQLHLDHEGQQRALDAQWQFTFQTYGLHRPSRDGVIQVFRAVTSHIGPAMPAILSIPVSAADSPDLVEQGWSDLRVAGTVVPWQLFPIDSTRAQSSHPALADPTHVLIPHEGFAHFEQRPHGLMEVVVPGDSRLFGTVLPWMVSCPIMREFSPLFVQWEWLWTVWSYTSQVCH